MHTRIAKIRQKTGLSQEKFAERLGLSRNYISLMETGFKPISKRTFKDICEKFSINEEWLRTGEGEMYCDEELRFSEICMVIGLTDPSAVKLIREYFELSDEDKKLFCNFMERFVDFKKNQ